MPEDLAPMPLIEAAGVDVVLGKQSIVSNVSMTVGAGEVVALIGPNGAGKTSMVRVLLGLLPPKRGTVRRRPGLKVGYMPQRMAIDPALPLTVERLLRLAVPSGDGVTARLQAALDEVGAGHMARGAMQDLSGGELQRVLLARALLRAPDLLVLDEPFTGLDDEGAELLDRELASLSGERTFLVATHDPHRLSPLASGRLVLGGS